MAPSPARLLPGRCTAAGPAARDAGATVRWADIRGDTTLDLDALPLSENTRLVAVGAAANAVGTVHPVAEVVRRAHAVGAEVFVDAVHYAPHRPIDVVAWGCDWCASSAYKFFGPHVGILWGRRKRLAELEAYRVRPSGETLPGKWMTGTQSFEGIAGTLAAVRYLEEVGFDAIVAWERELCGHLIEVIDAVPGLRLHGVQGIEGRVPTFGVTHPSIRSADLAGALGGRGFFVWSGDMYALECIKRLGLDPDGVVRIGALHYNTHDEIDRLAIAMGALCQGAV